MLLNCHLTEASNGNIPIVAQEHFKPTSVRLLVRLDWVLAPTKELFAGLP